MLEQGIKKAQVKSSVRNTRRPLPQLSSDSALINQNNSTEATTESKTNKPLVTLKSEGDLIHSNPNENPSNVGSRASVRKSMGPKQKQKRRGAVAEKVESVLFTQPIDITSPTLLDFTADRLITDENKQTEDPPASMKEDDDNTEFTEQKRKRKKKKKIKG